MSNLSSFEIIYLLVIFNIFYIGGYAVKGIYHIAWVVFIINNKILGYLTK